MTGPNDPVILLEAKQMKPLHVEIKRPEQDPENKRVVMMLKNLHDIIGGPVYSVKLKLRTGTRVAVFYGQNATPSDSAYNFTICPTEDPRTWIDIFGPAIITGRNHNTDALLHITLTDDERREIYKTPYKEI